jgi:HEAT repeat protein
VTAQIEEEKRYRSVLELDLSGASAVEALVQLLYDESWRVRGAAAERLACLPDRRVIAKLLATLGDRGHAGARNSAVEALTRLGLAAGPAVIALMGHPDPDQRRFAADILGGMRLREGSEALLAALEDADPNVRTSAAEALAKIGGEDAVHALKALLGAADPLMRLCGLEGLVELKCVLPISELSPLLEDAKARRAAYRLLGLIPDLTASDFICEGLGSGQRSVVEAALGALATQRSLLVRGDQLSLESRIRSALARMQSPREALENALNAADRDVQSGALFAAAVWGVGSLAPAMAEVARLDLLETEVVRALVSLGPAAADSLLERIDSLSRPARLAAGKALALLAGSSQVPRLAQLAERGDPEVQFLAIKALGQSTALEAVKPLVRMLSDDQLAAAAGQALLNIAQTHEFAVAEELEWSVTTRPTVIAVRVLAQVGKARSLPTLLRTGRDPDRRIRAASVEASAEMKGEAAIELARIGLADSDAGVRCAAARGLGSVRSEASEPLLRQALADRDAWVQAAAIESAGESRSIGLVPVLERLAASIDGLRAGRAVRALARMKKLSARLRQSAIRHRDPEVVKEALLAGAGPEGVSTALEFLSHERWDVRAAAARALSGSGRADVVPWLRSALERETDPLAREALAEAAINLSAH